MALTQIGVVGSGMIMEDQNAPAIAQPPSPARSAVAQPITPPPIAKETTATMRAVIAGFESST